MKKSPDFAANVWAELHAMHGQRLEVLEEVRERTFGMDHPVSFGTEEELAAACTRLHSTAARAGAGTEDFELNLVIDNRTGRGLGVHWDGSETLRIKAVMPGGLVEQWNKTRHKFAVKPGDLIVEVNKIRNDVLQMKGELDQNKELKLLVKRQASALGGKRREVNVDSLLRRLHNNEESKERRREGLEAVEKKVMKECTFTPKIKRFVSPGAEVIRGSGANVSERLYSQGKKRDEALREAREQQLEKEARQLQESSVHTLAAKKKARPGNGNLVQKGNVYERSLKWRDQLDRRIAETREGAALKEEKKMQESSIHRKLSGSTAAAARAEAVDRLYRVDLKRRKARDDERRQDRQRDIEKEFQEQELRSVHARAAARQWAPGELQQVRQRLVAGLHRAAKSTSAATPHRAEAEEEDEARREILQELCAALGGGRGRPSSWRLGQHELRRFADLCGFHGGDAAWAAQYEQLSDIYGFKAHEGLGVEHLEALTGDRDGRLHCSEEDLHFLLTLLGNRTELVMQLFHALDTNSSPGIGSKEMRKYAALTGFNGDAGAWAAAHAGLCATYGWSDAEEMDPWMFSQVVNDEDGEGHLADADFELLLVSLQSRPLLLARLFRALDVSGDGRLAAEELGHLAAARRRDFGDTGAAGPGEQYEALSRAHGWDPEAGVGARDFARMVNDTGSPAHCTTGELRWALEALRSRTELIVSAFGALDDSDSGRLPSACLRRYAEFCGFDGSFSEWQQEYKFLAAAHGWDERFGADLKGFASMVNDSSGNGYCSAEELLQFVGRGR